MFRESINTLITFPDPNDRGYGRSDHSYSSSDALLGPTASGYGAQFYIGKRPGSSNVSDRGTTAGLLALTFLGCLGLRKQAVR